MKGPKNGIVCASVNQTQFEPLDFQEAHCCLAISVGQPYHEETRLDTAINLIDENFSRCTISLGDTLQRHNMLDPENPNFDHYTAAKKAGDEWLERNLEKIKRLSIPYEIKRWDEWLKQDSFLTQLALLKATYHNDETFRQGFEITVSIFVDRLRKRNSNLNIEQAQANSRAFLFEECAIIMLMWQKENFNYIAYPGEMIDALRVTRDKFVEPYDNNLLKWLPLKFKRYSLSYLTSPECQNVFPSKQFFNDINIAKAA